jgi:uncharacterized membrane protein
MTSSRVLAAAALAGSSAILIAVLLATLALGFGAPQGVRAPFLLICHGQVERAFQLVEVALPICARCTGIYAGLALTAIPFVIVPGAARLRIAGRYALLLAGPMVLDGAMQTLGVWSSSNLPRAATGILFGISISWWAISSVRGGLEPATWDASAGEGELSPGN